MGVGNSLRNTGVAKAFSKLYEHRLDEEIPSAEDIQKDDGSALFGPPIMYILLGVFLVSLLVLAILPIVSAILIMGP